MDINRPNPYALPRANIEPVATSAEAAPPLWNPEVAVILSLLFTSLFGAILHMKNWQALGEPRKAAASRAWAWGSLIFLILSGTASAIWDDCQLIEVANVALLGSWYYANGRHQQRYILARFGDNYPQRGWAKPLLLAVPAAIVAFFAACVVIGFVIGIIDWAL